MFDTILLTSPIPDDVKRKNNITNILSNNCIYYLKFAVSLDPDEDLECKVKIIDANSGKVIEKRRFFNNTSFKFNCENATPFYEDICIISVDYEFPNFSESPFYLKIEIIEFIYKIIDALNTNPQKKNEIYELADKYLTADFKGAINEIGVIGEYIAREFAKKIHNRQVRNFRTALNILINENEIRRKRTNYLYLGSLLWPIYYIRNQKSHPYHKIEFNESTAKIAMENLSAILKYLAKTQFKF